MNFTLSLVIILGFIVPGTWLLLAGAVLSSDVQSFLRQLLVDPSLARTSFVLASAFALGALLDSARAVVFDNLLDLYRRLHYALRNGLARRLRRRERHPPLTPPPDYLAHVNDKSLPVFQMLIDRTQEYYRFNANSCLGIICVLVARWSQGQFGRLGMLLCVLAGLFYLASFKSRNETFYAMQQFCKSGEQSQCAKDSRALGTE